MQTNKNLPLIIGISLPILLILIFSVFLFLPTLTIKPKYNFIYSNESADYYYNNQYTGKYEVSNGRIVFVKNATSTDTYNNYYKPRDPELYLYDVKNNTTKQIYIDEVSNYVVERGPSSPDGYTVEFKYSNSGVFELFAGGGYESGYVISKGSASKKLDGLNSSGYRYNSNFKLVGWVK